VIDEDADGGVSRRSCSEDVKSEMQRPILGDVVVRRRIRGRDACDARAVARFGTQPATGVSEKDPSVAT